MRLLQPAVQQRRVQGLQRLKGYWRACHASTTRATVYFDHDIHRALRLKAAASGLSMSDLINRAVGAALSDDAEDLAAHRSRAAEQSLDFADVVLSLKATGRI